MIPETLLDHIKAKYGNFTPVRLTGGYTNETFLLQGTSPISVAKISNSQNRDMLNEISSLKLVQETGIAPKMYDHFIKNEFLVAVLEYRNGTNGQSILDKGDIETVKVLYKKLGSYLAKHIHSIQFYSSSTDIKKCNLHELDFTLDFIPETLLQKSKAILQELDIREENWVLTHGDYGIHNVLYTDEGEITILDWEWSEWSHPLTDVAWVCWFTSLHYPEYSNELNSLFIKEYLLYNPAHFSTEQLRAYCVYKVWNVLQRVKGAHLDVQKEWVRRLDWTIHGEMFDSINLGNVR